MDEKRIQQFMKSLDLTREEAIELLQDDEEINQMTKSSDIESDLSQEQKEAIKQSTKDHSGKYEKSAETIEREEKRRAEKASAMDNLMEAVEVVEIVKAGAEFIFLDNGIKYRCSIKRVRKQ